MNRISTLRLPMAALLLALVLTLLRQWQLTSAFDASGLPIHGSPATWALLAAVVLAVALWALLSRTLTPSAVLAAGSQITAGVLGFAGAVLVAMSSTVALYAHAQQPELISLLADVLGLAAGLSLCVTAGLTLVGRVPHPLVCMLPYIFLLLRLVSDFRSWSVDPVILDYCFRHFALIFSLGGLYMLAGFRFEAGKRRWAAFWAMGAIGFGAMAIPGTGLQDGLLYAGLALTMLSRLMRLSVRP